MDTCASEGENEVTGTPKTIKRVGGIDLITKEYKKEKNLQKRDRNIRSTGDMNKREVFKEKSIFDKEKEFLEQERKKMKEYNFMDKNEFLQMVKKLFKDIERDEYSRTMYNFIVESLLNTTIIINHLSNLRPKYIPKIKYEEKIYKGDDAHVIYLIKILRRIGRIKKSKEIKIGEELIDEINLKLTNIEKYIAIILSLGYNSETYSAIQSTAENWHEISRLTSRLMKMIRRKYNKKTLANLDNEDVFKSYRIVDESISQIKRIKNSSTKLAKMKNGILAVDWINKSFLKNGFMNGMLDVTHYSFLQLLDIIIARAHMCMTWSVQPTWNDIWNSIDGNRKLIIKEVVEQLHHVTITCRATENTRETSRKTATELNNISYTEYPDYNLGYILKNTLVSISMRMYDRIFKYWIEELMYQSHDNQKLKSEFKNVTSLYQKIFRDYSITWFLGLETTLGYNDVPDVEGVDKLIAHWVSKKEKRLVKPDYSLIDGLYIFKEVADTHEDLCMSSRFYAAGNAPMSKIINSDNTKETINKTSLLQSMPLSIREIFDNKEYIKNDEYQIRTALKLEHIKTRHVASTDYESYFAFTYIYNAWMNILDINAMERNNMGHNNTINKGNMLMNMIDSIDKKKNKITLDFTGMDETFKKEYIYEICEWCVKAIRKYYKDSSVIKTCNEILEFIPSYFDKLFVFTPSGLKFKYEDGMLSGLKITNLFESILNAAMFRTILRNRGYNYLEPVFCSMGDDFVAGTNQTIENLDWWIEEYKKFVMIVSKDKSYISSNNFDFLRSIFKDKKSYSWPMRNVISMLYNKPWNRAKILGVHEYITSWHFLMTKCGLSVFHPRSQNILLGPQKDYKLVKYMMGFTTMKYYQKTVDVNKNLNTRKIESKNPMIEKQLRKGENKNVATLRDIYNFLNLKSNPDVMSVLHNVDTDRNMIDQIAETIFKTLSDTNKRASLTDSDSIADKIRTRYFSEIHKNTVGIDFMIDKKTFMLDSQSRNKFIVLLSEYNAGFAMKLRSKMRILDNIIKDFSISKVRLMNILDNDDRFVKGISNVWGNIRKSLYESFKIKRFNKEIYIDLIKIKGTMKEKEVDIIDYSKQILNSYGNITRMVLNSNNKYGFVCLTR